MTPLKLHILDMYKRNQFYWDECVGTRTVIYITYDIQSSERRTVSNQFFIQRLTRQFRGQI